MKKIISLLLCVCLALLTACSGEEQSSTQAASELPPSQAAEDAAAELDVIRATLISYLNDCWGYREGIHTFVFDKTIELQDSAYHAFLISSPGNETTASFAISLDEKKVFFLNEVGDWIEDINPEPWPKW